VETNQSQSELPQDEEPELSLRPMRKIAGIAGMVSLLLGLVVGVSPLRAAALLLISLAAPISAAALRYGGPKRSVETFLGLLWAAMVLETAGAGGLTSPALEAGIFLILLAGALLGTAQALWLAGATLIWVAVMALANAKGWWLTLPIEAGAMQLLGTVAVWSGGLAGVAVVWRARDHQLQTLRETARAIDAAESKLAQLMTASPLPITVANFKSGVYVDVNPAWERFFQYGKSDAMGKTSVDLGFWKDMGERQGWIDRFSAEGRVSGYEVTFLMRDRTPRIFMLSSERFVFGKEDCVLTMSVDITERRRLEHDLTTLNATLEERVAIRTSELHTANLELSRTMQTLQRATDELVQSEKLAALGSLVAGISHELNTPLGNAMVTTSAMKDAVSDLTKAMAEGSLKKSAFDGFVERFRAGTELTSRSVERAVHLVASFKQVSVDQASERRRPFDVAQVVTEVIDTIRPNLKHKPFTIKLEATGGIIMDSFPGPLGQVLINLVSNAMTHAYEGSDGGEILVEIKAPGGQVVQLRVSDDGCGIRPEHLAQIFDPFFTTKLGHGGSGLGLSISHRIVTRLLGGHITVHSVVGLGTRFDLELPVTAPEAALGTWRTDPGSPS
jgi:PAS domain S-box-containing protein